MNPITPKTKFADMIIAFGLTVVFALVLAYFLMHIWNSSIVVLFGARLMTIQSALGLIVIVWMVARIATEAFIGAIVGKLTILLQDEQLKNLIDQKKNKNVIND